MPEPQPGPPKREIPSKDGTEVRRRRKRRLRWVLVVLVVLLIGAELALRLVFGLGTPLLYQRDAACSYLPLPNQRIHRFFCTNEINAFSMRSAPVKSPKPAGEFRAMFLGDSVLYGTTYVDQSRICTSLLAAELPGLLSRPVEVLNASAGGWAIENETAYLRSRGSFDADVVIVVVNTFDLTQPFNEVVPGTEPGFPDHAPPLALIELWSRYLKPRLFHIAIGDRGASVPAVADENVAVEQTLRSLDEACQIARQHGARFGLIYSPAVGPDDQPYAHFKPYVDRLRDWARSADIPMLDLTAAYAAVPGSGVYQDGIHLRAEGQRLMANAIEQWPFVTNPDRSRRDGK